VSQFMLGNLNKQMKSDIARGNTIRILADAIFHFAICFLLINKRGGGGMEESGEGSLLVVGDEADTEEPSFHLK
jgi:hypothetical protein